jgi:signal transduction histidine kinase
LLQEHTPALGDYLTSAPKGKQIPTHLVALGDHLTQEWASVLKELSSLSNKIEHIRQIISMQQDFTRVGGLKASENLAGLMDEALAINFASLERHHIQVIREYAEIPLIALDRQPVLQILVNLINNAKYARVESPDWPHRLTLQIGMPADREGFVRLQVQDTGVGIKPEHLSRIFAQGFTTKKEKRWTWPRPPQCRAGRKDDGGLAESA